MVLHGRLKSQYIHSQLPLLANIFSYWLREQQFFFNIPLLGNWEWFIICHYIGRARPGRAASANERAGGIKQCSQWRLEDHCFLEPDTKKKWPQKKGGSWRKPWVIKVHGRGWGLWWYDRAKKISRKWPGIQMKHFNGLLFWLNWNIGFNFIFYFCDIVLRYLVMHEETFQP